MGVIGYCTHLVFGILLLSVKMPEIQATGPYPRESETREVKKLDGLWNFLKSDPKKPMQGVDEQWFLSELNHIRPTIKMVVPASYNDITQDITLRDHVGTVWYERNFFIPISWNHGQKVFMRFESVHYFAYVWINGNIAIKHEFGHLPFEIDITELVKYGKENRVTVMCDNVLLATTIPQGKVFNEQTDNDTRIQQSYTFDFFNYAGIHRSVFLYTTPENFIQDILVTTEVNNNDGIINYSVKINSNDTENYHLIIEIRDKLNNLVANETTQNGQFNGRTIISNVNLWWPYLMNKNFGYLYTLTAILVKQDVKVDFYRLNIGVRTLKWNDKEFTINGKPIYFHGFGKHEDSDIRGKGFDNAILLKDFELLHWIGANTIRTSHYPYSDEFMSLADEYGIMVIDECASVDTDIFNAALLIKHQSNLKQLIHRDKNHPSVIMWSIANEPRTANQASGPYFESVAKFVRSLDPTRPITAAIAVNVFNDKAGYYLDIISFNRYQAWYQNTGRLDMITQNTIDEACSWRKKYNKPVLMSEYGADTIAGLHLDPAFVWSEEFQQQSFSKHFKAFDTLRSQCFFIGEFVWNFADFKTAQTITRVGGNKKGVMTRERQPKSSAYLLRQRYFMLSNKLYGVSVPEDLFYYVIDSSPSEVNKN